MIVIGAGVSGLEAARRLDRAGLNVLVVEARPRVGGRIETHRLAGWPTPVEAGAEFVHGLPSILIRRLRAVGARLVKVPASRVTVEKGDVRPANRLWRRAQAVLERLPDEDTAFQAWLARPAVRVQSRPEVRRMARDFVEGFNAADAARASAKALHQQTEASDAEHGERLHRVQDGYDVLPERLARPLGARGRLLLGCAVTAIRRRADGVEVSAEDTFGGPARRLHASAALVTLPLGVLQAESGSPGAVKFEPALPTAKRDAIARLAMGRVIKVVLRFRGPLGSGPLSRIPPATTFLQLPRAAVPTWWVPVPAPPRCLVGWMAGPAADRFAARHADQGARIRAAIRALAGGLDVAAPELARFLEDALVFDWGLDQWTRGAYSWVPRGAVTAAAALAAPLGTWLFFAGEATDTNGDVGTVHAALASGARAAAEILKGRRPRVRSDRGASRRD